MKTKIISSAIVFTVFLFICPAVRAITVSVPRGLTASPGQIGIKVPVNISDLNGQEAIQLIIQYNSEVLEATGIDRQGTLTQGDLNLGPEVNITSGKINIGLAKVPGFTGTGVLLYILFDVISNDPSDKSNLTISQAEFDEQPADTINNGDITLPVELSSFTAQTWTNKIIIEWITKSEVNHLGWNIYRSENKAGHFIKINSNLIKAKAQAASYQYIDENIIPDQTYFYYLEDISISGERSKSTIITTGNIQFLTLGQIKNALLQNFPNPFNPETWIPYELANPAKVEIRIYNLKGELIHTLNLGHKSAGFYMSKERAAHWDGRNEAGEQASSGVYFYQITSGDFTATRKMILMK